MRINSEYIKAYFDDNLGGGNPHTPDCHINSKFKIGNLYTIQGEECDNFTMPTRIYKMVGECHSLNGVEVNGIVMKQISGEKNSMMFSLTKTDCKILNIEFQNGLQVFSKELNWKPLIDENKLFKELPKNKFFDENDLSTYPVDSETMKIRKMCVKIGGFMYDIKLDENEVFIRQFITRLKNDLKIFTNNSTKSINRNFDYNIITNHITKGKHKVFDRNGNLFVEVDFGSVYGISGLEPQHLSNNNINDVIKVYLG